MNPSQIKKAEQDARNTAQSISQDATNVIFDKKMEGLDGTESTRSEVSALNAKTREFRYPLSMPMSGKGYPGTITFTAYKIDGKLDLGASLGSAFDRATKFLSGTDTDISEAEIDARATESALVLAEQKANAGKKNRSTTSYENTSRGEPVGKVVMPLQRDLRFSDNVTYDSPPLGALGAGLEAMGGGRNPFAGATNGDGTFTTTAAALAAQAVAKASGAGIGAIVGKLAGSALGGAVIGSGATEGLGDAVRSSTRISSAPNHRTLFKEVQLRQFSFTFKMIANSEREAFEIKQIIKFFRQELYPEKITVGDENIPIAYKFPNVFELQVKNQTGGNPASKIQRCYLKDVQTSYNSTGNGLHTDGSFVECDLTINFQEISALDKNMIRDRGY